MVKRPLPELSPLIIDKLRFTLAIKDALLQSAIMQNAAELFAAGIGNSTIEPIKKGGDRYRLSYNLLLDHGQTKCAISIDPLQPGVRFMQVTFNPGKASKKARASIKRHLRALLLDKYEELMSRPFISRLDVTLDISNVNINSLLIYDKLKRKCNVHYGSDGATETINIGGEKSDVMFNIYDKKTQLSEADGVFINEERTRFEAQLTFSRKALMLHALHLLKNPFSSLQVISLGRVTRKDQDANAGQEDLIWRFFLDACRKKGAHAALRNIRNDRVRAKYRDRLAACPVNWWKPAKAWRGLRKAIEELDLFPEAAFIADGPEEKAMPAGKKSKRKGSR